MNIYLYMNFVIFEMTNVSNMLDHLLTSMIYIVIET